MAGSTAGESAAVPCLTGAASSPGLIGIRRPGLFFLPLKNSIHRTERFYQHYTGVAAITQEREVHLTEKGFAYLTRRIGSTTYKVRVHFSDTGTETMNDKIVRLIQNEALTSAPGCAIMETPQMSQPLEGSSL